MVEKNKQMNEMLASHLAELVQNATIKHHCIFDTIPQIGAYHGSKVKLIELTTAEVTLGTHQHGAIGHIFMFPESIKSLKEDYAGRRSILPKIIFTYGIDSKKVKMQPGKLDQISFGDMSKDFFDIFVSLQRLLHQKVH